MLSQRKGLCDSWGVHEEELQDTKTECAGQESMESYILGSGGWWAFLVAQMVKNMPAMWETWVQSFSQEDPLEKWLPTPVFLPREFHWQRILEGYSPWYFIDWVTNTHTEVGNLKQFDTSFCSNAILFEVPEMSLERKWGFPLVLCFGSECKSS